MKVAAVGDRFFISGFMMVGAEGFEAESDDEALKLVKELESAGYGLVILPERFVECTRETRFRLIREGRTTPIFTFLPDFTGVKGQRLEELKRSISLAVGAELKL
ncbi:MAG: V-type ATP synthase subunit F [Candidatus Bathyarchaeia archaeon]